MTLTLIPESAPFNAEQRAWLNGFFAGWLGMEDAPSPTIAPPVDDHPWHDPALPIADRLALAESAPLPHRLMAAMAQLDCGACGYVCRTYSEAIASGEESSLTLCSPGGSETSKAIKRLLKDEKPSGAIAVKTTPVETTPQWSRRNPYPASILRSERLNGPESEKETRHVEIDLNGSGLVYKVGDALGVVPSNCDELVDDLITAIRAKGDEPVTTPQGNSTSLREALWHDLCLTEITEDFLGLLATVATNADEARTLKELCEDDTPIFGHDILDVLHKFPSARPDAHDLARCLAPMKARLYSISSSPRKHAGQVHLTVSRVAYQSNGRTRKGVASTMFADRVQPGSRARVFVHPAPTFTIPADPNAAIIMIGPGTGIAPFRAFLHERHAIGAKGKNWLFFGDQRSASDFLYEDELLELQREGVLTHLDTAFSRDQEEKIYVQHRIRERGPDLFRWIDGGASLYVCGDARRMAVDVDRAIRDVIARESGRNDEAVAAYMSSLISQHRYHRDVY